MSAVSDKKRNSLADYLLLYFSVGIYSCSSLCSKFASGYDFLSWGFILFYGGSIFVLMVYAFLWQLVLKRFDLSVAYSGKPVSMLLSMVWGIALFREAITWNMVVGAIVIVIGMRMVMSDHGK